MILQRKYLNISLILQLCAFLQYYKGNTSGKKSDKLKIAVIPEPSKK